MQRQFNIFHPTLRSGSLVTQSHTFSLSLKGVGCGPDRSSMSELLELDEDTLI